MGLENFSKCTKLRRMGRRSRSLSTRTSLSLSALPPPFLFLRFFCHGASARLLLPAFSWCLCLKNRVFLNPWLGEPMVCTLDSRGFRHFRGFRDFRESSTQLLVCSCLSCPRRFRRFRVVSVVFVVSGDPHPNHRFAKKSAPNREKIGTKNPPP